MTNKQNKTKNKQKKNNIARYNPKGKKKHADDEPKMFMFVTTISNKTNKNG